MRFATCLIVLCFVIGISSIALCQGPPPAPDSPPDAVDSLPAPPPPPAPGALPAPPPPSAARPAPPPGPNAPGTPGQTPWLHQRGNPYVIVGPTDSQTKPKMVRGKINIIARPANDVKVSSVAVLVDGNSVGSASGDRTGLFGLEHNTSALVDGLHTVKCVGTDATGKEVWSASSAVEVRNKRQETSKASPNTFRSQPNKKTPEPAKQATAVTQSQTPVAAPSNPPAAVQKPKPTIASTAFAPGKTYTSVKHGFIVRPPAGWIAKDKTPLMKPKAAGNGWVEFTSQAVPGLAVNIRRMELEDGATAERFAKHNPYVSKWERKTVAGTEAFVTRTDVGNRIIHRTIVIKGGIAWMLNCVDGDGKTSGMGQAIFDSMVASFSIGAKPAVKAAARVNVSPVKKPTAKAAKP